MLLVLVARERRRGVSPWIFNVIHDEYKAKPKSVSSPGSSAHVSPVESAPKLPRALRRSGFRITIHVPTLSITDTPDHHPADKRSQAFAGFFHISDCIVKGLERGPPPIGTVIGLRDSLSRGRMPTKLSDFLFRRCQLHNGIDLGSQALDLRRGLHSFGLRHGLHSFGLRRGLPFLQRFK